MARPFNAPRMPQGQPAKAPAFRGGDAADSGHYPKAPGAQRPLRLPVPATGPGHCPGEQSTQWYGLGGTG
jgi:hypothetical protein